MDPEGVTGIIYAAAADPPYLPQCTKVADRRTNTAMTILHRITAFLSSIWEFIIMSLESIIADDQAALEAANAAAAAAQAKLTADQTALANAQPVISLLAQIEAAAAPLDDATKAALLALTAQAKALF